MNQRKIFNKIIIAFVSLLFMACKSSPELKTGLWRGEIPTAIGLLPIHFEITNDNTTFNTYVINGEERLEFDTTYIQGDSVYFKMDIFDAEIVAKINGYKLEGFFRKKMANLSLREGKFTAEYKKPERFFSPDHSPPKVLSNKYEVVFNDGENSYPAVGVFKQTNDLVLGTFLTSTGDYRYLQGNVFKDSLMLSCFDGNHIFIFKAQIKGDSLVGGKFCYSLSGIETWNGIANQNASLPDPNSLTYLKPGYSSINFSFPDLEGKKVSLKDEKFKNKVVVVQVLGSWCPNCMDETRFLADFHKKYQKKGFETVGLAFEKSLEPNFANPRIERIKKRFGVEYPILLAGLNDKEDASNKLPMLNKIISFPTTIIIDKKGNVRKIHTGFSGPGTGVYYEKFISDFTHTIESLLEEKII
jgi:thiol-disulfide isomerase/thioredoxin